ncbi:MAG: uroporphyrinogen-III C-methyltransferase [Rhodocyclales bacterium]|nr:uroporphyrinogen-III C-methyltransferase [Rhodocyclales bacterium]
MEAPQQTETTPQAAGWREALRRPTTRVALVALAVIVVQWVDTRMQVSGLQHEVARRSADVDATAKAGRAQLQQMQEALAAQQAKVGVLEARLAETQSQAVALEAMYQELSSSRDERLLAEVEQAVVIAMQQLQFSGNVEAALIALQGAEARLGRSVQPQFLPARKLIARDIERLKGIPGANISGLSLKIESVVAAVDGLPLAFEQRPTASAKRPAAAPKPSSTDFWRELGADLWREFRQLVRVERIEHGDPALLAPQQSYFLRENLKLRLLNARLALLQRDGRVFREEIRQSREHLDRYFDNRAKPVLAAQATLSTLATTDVSFDLPGMTETLNALRNLKLARERRGSGGK